LTGRDLPAIGLIPEGLKRGEPLFIDAPSSPPLKKMGGNEKMVQPFFAEEHVDAFAVSGPRRA
jgi:hypothetical protein